MTGLKSEVLGAFRSMGVSEDKALRAASALAKRDDEVGSIKAELLLMKWMLGFVLAFQIAFAFKFFVH